MAEARHVPSVDPVIFFLAWRNIDPFIQSAQNKEPRMNTHSKTIPSYEARAESFVSDQPQKGEVRVIGSWTATSQRTLVRRLRPTRISISLFGINKPQQTAVPDRADLMGTSRAFQGIIPSNLCGYEAQQVQRGRRSLNIIGMTKEKHTCAEPTHKPTSHHGGILRFAQIDGYPTG